MTQKHASPPTTRDKIIKEAENLFSQYNYNSVSLNDIAKKNSITKAALYYHFKNKEELFSEILKKAHDGIGQKLNKLLNSNLSLEKKLRKILMTGLDMKINQRYLTNLTVQKLSKNDQNISKLLCDFKDETLKIFIPMMKEIINKCGYPKETDPKMLAFFLMSSLKGYNIQKTCGGCNEWTAEQFANEIITIILRK